MVEQKDTGSEFNFLDSIVDTSVGLKMISSLFEVKIKSVYCGLKHNIVEMKTLGLFCVFLYFAFAWPFGLYIGCVQKHAILVRKKSSSSLGG